MYKSLCLSLSVHVSNRHNHIHAHDNTKWSRTIILALRCFTRLKNNHCRTKYEQVQIEKESGDLVAVPALLWRVGGSRIASSFAAKAPGTVKSHGTVSQAISSPALLIKQTLESLRPRPCHVAASPRHFPRGTPLPILRACASFSSLSAAADLPTSTAQAQQRNGPYLHTPCKPEMGAGACACELGAAAARRHQCCHARQESWIRMVGLGGPVSAWRAACSCRVPVATTTAACSIDARQQSRPLAPGTASFNRRPRPVGAEAGCIAVISCYKKFFGGINKCTKCFLQKKMANI